MVTIYHNPRCRKSRETLKLLEDKGQDIDLVLYLETPPSRTELVSILGKLGMEPLELVRTNEAIWKEHFKGKKLSPDAVIDAMLKYPKLIERPIVVNGDKAALGRPPEEVIKVL